MLTRVIIFTFVAFAAGVVLAMSHSFRTTASGRLHNPIMFEFYHDSTTRAKTDVESFGVSVRTPDHRWKAIWSIDGGHRLAQPIQYGVAPDGFAARIVPQKLLSGHTYLAFASARGGGLSSMYFRFQKDGAIIFPDSPD